MFVCHPILVFKPAPTASREIDVDEGPHPKQPPGAVAAAGVLETMLGSLLILFGLVLVNRMKGLSGPGFMVLLITFTQGVLDVMAGIRILQLRNDGRILGIVMASIGLAGALLTLAGQAAGGSIILILIGTGARVLVILWLVQNRSAFVR
jgi:hypothetical protein